MLSLAASSVDQSGSAATTAAIATGALPRSMRHCGVYYGPLAVCRGMRRAELQYVFGGDVACQAQRDKRNRVVSCAPSSGAEFAGVLIVQSVQADLLKRGYIGCACLREP